MAFMTTTTRRFGAVVLLLLACGIPARPDTPGDAEGRLLRDLKFLTSDQCEGRGIQTKGINLAADYIARQFSQAGLQPGGPDGTFFQPFNLTTGGKANSASLVLQGHLGQSIALTLDRHFNVNLLGSSGKAQGPLVFAGYGITADDPKYDDYAGLDVTGKIVIVLSGTPRRGSRQADVFSAAGRISPFLSTASKIENAQKHKAAGILLVNARAGAQGFGQGGGGGGFGAGGLPRSTISLRDGDPYSLPVLNVQREVVDNMLLTTTGQRLEQIEQAIDADLKPRSQAVPGWSAQVETSVTHTQITVKNVVGVLPGYGDLAKETIVIGAHYDHVGMGATNRFGGMSSTAVTGPGSPGGVGLPLSAMSVSAIHRGADDNASGTATVIELARRFGQAPKKDGRRIVFIAFTAEESGLIGSAYYCKKPLFPLNDTTTMINMDMVGRLQDNKLMVGGLGTAKEFQPLVEKLNEKHGFDLAKEPSGQGPSDHASFYAKNIPVLKFFTGFHEQYHRPSDRLETLAVTGMGRIARLIGDVAEELRSQPTRPECAKTSAFDRTKTLWANAPATGILIDHANKTSGILVEDVVTGTAAAKAGLKKGDRVLSVGGKPTPDASSFLTITRALKLGEKVELTFERAGKEEKAIVQLARAPRGLPDTRFGFIADFTDIKDGVLLVEVPADTPAGKAGLKAGDRLTSIEGQPITDQVGYFNLRQGLSPNTQVQLAVQRDGKPLTFQVEVGEMRTTPQPQQRGGGGPGGRGAGNRLGLLPEFRTGEQTEVGVRIASVREGTSAEKAGVKAGDRLLAINGKEVKDLREFAQMLRDLQEAKKLELTIERGGQRQQVQVVLE